MHRSNTMRVILTCAFCISILACEQMPLTKDKYLSEKPCGIAAPVPQEFQEEITNVQIRGTEIYAQDVAAWVATDFLKDKGVLDYEKRLQGWITEHVDKAASHDTMKVIFIGRKGGQFLGFHQINVSSGAVILSIKSL